MHSNDGIVFSWLQIIPMPPMTGLLAATMKTRAVLLCVPLVSHMTEL